MSQVYLLPRLGHIHAIRFLDQIQNSPEALAPPDRSYLEEGFSAASYGATGGTRSEKVVCDIAERIRMTARRYGFLGGTTTQEQRSEFDSKVSILLALCPEFRTGEGMRDDVWAFISIILLPDVVAWRFQGCSHERYMGGVRNAFQRLWVRGVGLDRGEGSESRWELVTALTEDALVQIFERPSLASNLILARGIAEAWLSTSKSRQIGAMENVARSAIKMIRLRNEVIDISEMGFCERDRLLTEDFNRAADTFLNKGK